MRTTALFAAAVLTADQARGGSTVVGQLFPPPMTQVTSNVSGLTFDGQPGALILENHGDVKRVSVINAAVLETPIDLADVGARSSLDHQPSTGHLWTIRRAIIAPFGEQDALYRIAPGGTETLVGGTGGLFAWPSFAFDPAENLWGVSDNNIFGITESNDLEPRLYTLDKSTGAATHAVQLTGITNQVQTLAIDEGGQFFVSTAASIYRVNPATGASTIVTTTGLDSPLNHFSDIAYDAAADKWFGVETRRSISPREYYLREITGMPAVPEPSALALTAAAAATVALRRRRRRDGMNS